MNVMRGTGEGTVGFKMSGAAARTGSYDEKIKNKYYKQINGRYVKNIQTHGIR